MYTGSCFHRLGSAVSLQDATNMSRDIAVGVGVAFWRIDILIANS